MAAPNDATQSPANPSVDLTPGEFEENLHTDIAKPIKNFRMRWVGGLNDRHRKRQKIHNGAHRADWAEAAINLRLNTVSINVYLNFKRSDLNESEYQELKSLACDGINRYWSRYINVGGKRFNVSVNASHREGRSIPVDLYIEKDKDYSRSMNPAILGIDASFTYNKGLFDNIYGTDSRGNPKAAAVLHADNDFKLVSAHEFGHSVLMYVEGLSMSWGHKGSTHPIRQSVKSSTPGYPTNGAIDLMKYYDWEKESAGLTRRVTDTIAMDVDVKRLIWGAALTWVK